MFLNGDVQVEKKLGGLGRTIDYIFSNVRQIGGTFHTERRTLGLSAGPTVYFMWRTIKNKTKQKKKDRATYKLAEANAPLGAPPP